MGKARKAERSDAQLELDIVRIVELKNSGRTSEEIARVLNNGREPEQHVAASTIRSQWAAYVKRLRPKTEEDALKLLGDAIARHQMLLQEALRGYAEFLRAGNPAAGTLLMGAMREQREIDRLRGVQPRKEEEGDGSKDDGKPFQTREEAVEFMRLKGLGGRVLPYAAERRKRK